MGKFCDKSGTIYAKMMQKLYDVNSEMVMLSKIQNPREQILPKFGHNITLVCCRFSSLTRQQSHARRFNFYQTR